MEPVRHAAVLGSPVAHSLSPLLHTAAYAALGLPWRYHALSCGAGDLAALLVRVRRSDRWAGLSLTMPLKEVAVGLLDEVRTDLGVVNTVVHSDGRLVGYNTDPHGVLAGLIALGPAAEGPRAAVLGAGGTARAVLAALAEWRRPEVTVHCRDAGRAAPLVALAARLGIGLRLAGLDAIEPGTVLVSTLPPGASETLARAAGQVAGPVLDVVYSGWPTPLARAALAAGYPAVGGLEVLVGQALEQVRLMTGRSVAAGVLRAAAVAQV